MIIDHMRPKIEIVFVSSSNVQALSSVSATVLFFLFQASFLVVLPIFFSDKFHDVFKVIIKKIKNRGSHSLSVYGNEHKGKILGKTVINSN